MSTPKKLVAGAAVLGLAAWVFWPRGKKPPTRLFERIFNPGDITLPISGVLTFDERCLELAVRLDLNAYDHRITQKYWALKREGVTDSRVITEAILEMDAPDCSWPPDESASFRVRELWDILSRGVAHYQHLDDQNELQYHAGVWAVGEI